MKICNYCKIEFKSKYPFQVYCSNTCRWKEGNDNKRLKRQLNQKPRKILVKNCVECETEFETIYIDKTYCSSKCRYKVHWRTRKEINPEKRILERRERTNKNRVRINAQNKIIQNKNKEKYAITNKKWAEDNPEKVKARKLVAQDKKKNPHLYSNECMICGATKNIEFHHPDYNFPLSVYPLCKKHHRQVHNPIKT